MDKRELLLTADLAQLKMTTEEMDRLDKEVSEMLEYFTKMMEMDLEHLEPTTHALFKENRVRPDQGLDHTIAGDILDRTPESEDRFIAIPNVL